MRIRNWIVACFSVVALVALVGGVGWAWSDTGQPDTAPTTTTTVTPPKVNHKSRPQSPPITEIPEYAQEPSPPSVSITCPPDGYGNEVSFGGKGRRSSHQRRPSRSTMEMAAPDKTSRRSYFNSAYRHTYHMTGTFTVRIVLTERPADCL